ncbi:hypothetical protein HZ326_10634 [Fusarium oxysporum f. sp. albedinis]|nr:hypothetical protein HZ326_10634 [Fusarium oxysporum f. sp. albedinis]
MSERHFRHVHHLLIRVHTLLSPIVLCNWSSDGRGLVQSKLVPAAEPPPSPFAEYPMTLQFNSSLDDQLFTFHQHCIVAVLGSSTASNSNMHTYRNAAFAVS